MTCDERINITIIGGSKGLGKWIAEDLAHKNFNVTITSRNKTSGKKTADKLKVKYSNNNIKAVKDAKIIIFCVPIEHMTKTIKEVAPHAPDNTLLMDVTSIKKEPSEALHKYAPKTAEILPCHPMFGPRIPSLDGQVVILTPTEDRCEKSLPVVMDFLKKNNVQVVLSTPEEHDKIMSVVQGLTHFSYIAIASTIRKLDISVKKSREFSSPIYSLMLDMITRIVSQNPYLYYSIQKSNKETHFSRKTLIEESIYLSNLIENNEEDKFVDNMRESAKHLDEFEEALSRSDKAISILTNDLNLLKTSIGSKMGLKHRYSGKVHVGVVKAVTNDTVTITENNKDVTLKISNLTVLSREELFDWKVNNMKTHEFDLSVMFPKTCDSDVLLNIISNIDQVIFVEVIDIYEGKQVKDGFMSITFHYSTFDKDDKAVVESYVEGMGGIIR